MARNSRPRKAYRPRPIGRPVCAPMLRDLILPCYSALETLRAGTDPEALSHARWTLGGLLEYLRVGLSSAGRPLETVTAGMAALDSLIERHGRTGTYRCTGSELAALRASVVEADEVLPLLGGTHKLAAALGTVYAAMERATR